ncbi:MAG: amino acid adenylation domain-containing protein [Pseudoflavonifractor sp.]|nr:amino acid adenylation domain-containing protein [Alloprevotella sp.]MCM1116149.1 amino acid adenylation domain-containing protein [Pseudoflavonifractor sp.]
MSNTIYSKFKEIVKKYPDLKAIEEADRSLTYAELDRMANSIMAKFYDAKPEAVGIVMRHGAEQIAAMLAVVKSGAAYVPAEPRLPQERIDYMMETAGVSFIINDNYCRNVKPTDRELPDRSTPDGVAYILYTSGTSGKPKGVMVENHSVANYAEAFEAEFHTGPGDVMLQYSVCSFDIFVEEVFTTLLSGATLCIPSEAIHNSKLPNLMKFAERHGVTIIDGFPYLIAEINKAPEILPESVKLIISGGDVIRGSYITNLRDKGVKIYNTYGPSETTVCSNYYRVDNAEPLDDGTFPVGKAVKGVSVKILDKGLKEVKKGETGEICILGEGVSRGYLGNPPEQDNFVTLPGGTRMYRSGDLGYELPDGNIAFLHRRDDQVMILGKRVEPEEVENVLNTCPCVERGVVKAFKDENGLHYLVAYIVPEDDCKLGNVKKWLAARLTDFMIPEFFVKVREIPLTRRGKVDVAALPVVMKEGGLDD